MFIRVGSLAATLLGSVVLARALGPASFGIYSLALAIVTILALPAQVGIPTLLVRETARTQAAGKWSEMKGLWRWSTRVILVSSLVIAAGSSLALFLYPRPIKPDLLWAILAGLVLVPLIALGNARGAALRGLRHIVRGQLPESVIRPLVLVLLVYAVWAGGQPVTADSVMAFHALAAVLAYAVGGEILRRSRPRELASVCADMAGAAGWWRAALPLALISALQVVSSQCGVIVLALFRPEAEVGLYKVAASAATIALFGMQTATMVLSPHLARTHAMGDVERLKKLTALGALVSTALTLPILVIFLAGGRGLIGMVYGEEYDSAFLPLAVLTVGQAVNAMFGCVGALLGMVGYERDAARWLSVSALVNIVLAFVLVPVLGMMGAAISSVASILVWNLAFWLIAKMRLGIDSSFLPAVPLAFDVLRGWMARRCS
ncbi:oligosaccharide flippase family protein [Flagellatimonas centrodinii]|nr:oligosaccharide flippase family protein [Flagellatimonas centrodinii]ULQ48301.1 oligosaccharide flippase family protein [Flagellatimonas centrodinii]